MSGPEKVAFYGINLYFNASIINATACSAPSTGFLSAVNLNTPGEVISSGFDTSGKGPSAELHLLNVTFDAVGKGTTVVDVEVPNFGDSTTATIGTPKGIDGSVTVN